MSETKWTPAPWFLINDCCVGGPIEPGWEEAGCGIAHCGMRARTPEEAAANARLIAAAPELYEALTTLSKYCAWQLSDGTDHHPTLGSALGKARAVLAKARGEQP